MVIGLISDTHGLLRPEAVNFLTGVDLVMHAGDICGAHILPSLQAIAPVLHVRGNNDFLHDGPLTVATTQEGVSLLMIHELAHITPEMLTERPDIIIFGHSHKPALYEEAGVTYLNPGAAGKRRFSLPISIARLHLDVGTWHAEFINLLENVPLP